MCHMLVSPWYRAFSLIELMVSMLIGTILIISMHTAYWRLYSFFDVITERMDFIAKGYFIKDMIDKRFKSSDVIKVCSPNIVDSKCELPERLKALLSSGKIETNQNIVCFVGYKEHVAYVDDWRKFWSRYVKIKSDSEDVRALDFINVNSKDCLFTTQVLDKNKNKLFLSSKPNCNLSPGDSVYRVMTTCLFVLKSNGNQSLYLYEDNREILGVVDGLSTFRLLDDLDLIIGVHGNNFTYHTRAK